MEPTSIPAHCIVLTVFKNLCKTDCDNVTIKRTEDLCNEQKIGCHERTQKAYYALS